MGAQQIFLVEAKKCDTVNLAVPTMNDQFALLICTAVAMGLTLGLDTA